MRPGTSYSKRTTFFVLVRPAGALPLPVIRSLAYFLPVIKEALSTQVDPRYYQHVRNKLQRLHHSQMVLRLCNRRMQGTTINLRGIRECRVFAVCRLSNP